MSKATHLLAGEIVGNVHSLIQRVYYEDTDFSGVVYHARYLHFMERGRTDYLRCLGIHQNEMAQNDGLAFVVFRMEIDFKASARMDDIVEIRTWTDKAFGARLVMGQEIVRDGQVLIAAKVTVAVIGGGRPRRLPQPILDAMTHSV